MDVLRGAGGCAAEGFRAAGAQGFFRSYLKITNGADVLDSSRVVDNGILKKLLISPKDFFSTYRWADLASLQKKRPPRPAEAIAWWKFLLFSSFALILSLAISIICTVQMNALSFGSFGNVTNAAQIIAEIGRSASRINDDLIAHRPGSDTMVMVGAMVFWFALASVIATISTFVTEAWSFRKGRFEESCYIIAVITLKYSFVWILISIVAVVVRILNPSLLKNSTSSDVASWIFVACNLAAVVAVWGWLLWGNAERFTRKISPTRLSVFTVLSLMSMSGFLIQIGSLIAHNFPPRLNIQISSQCDSDGCYVYARSFNSRKMVLDSPARFRFTMNYWDKNPSTPEKKYGRATITLSQIQVGSGPVILEPGAEQILRVKKIALECDANIPSAGSLVPIAVDEGQTSVHIPNRSVEESQAPIAVNLSGFLLPLFRDAGGTCSIRV